MKNILFGLALTPIPVHSVAALSFLASSFAWKGHFSICTYFILPAAWHFHRTEEKIGTWGDWGLTQGHRLVDKNLEQKSDLQVNILYSFLNENHGQLPNPQLRNWALFSHTLQE